MDRTTAAQSLTRDRLRAATKALEDRGITEPDELLRLGAAVMVERCCAAFDARSDTSSGWLAEAVRAGGSWSAVQALAPSEPPSRFAEYDEAAGL